MRIGVIADTHSLLRPEVEQVFTGVDHILHAGDIGRMEVIETLRRIAPVTYVDGNNDSADGYDIVRLDLGGKRVLLTHILPRPRDLGSHVRKSLAKQEADLVIFGHSHLPHDEMVDGVHFFNPASAGPRRFDLPVSVGILEIGAKTFRTMHVALDARSKDALQKRMNQLV